MRFPVKAWAAVAAAAVGGVAMASCTILAPTGTNTAPDAFPTPDASGVVLIVHQRVDEAAEKFLFQIEVASDAPGTAPAPVSVDSTEGDVQASFNVRTLGLEPGVHRVLIFEGADDTAPAAAERVFVVPVPAADAGASGT